MVARRLVSERQVLSTRFFTGTALAGLLANQPAQIQVLFTGETQVIDVRGFGADGLSGYYTIQVTGSTANIYDPRDWSIVARALKVADFYESWKVSFDRSSGRWKIEQKLAGGLK